MNTFPLFPPSASNLAPAVDNLLFLLLGVSGFFTLLILVLIVYFALRYRRTSEAPPPATPANYSLEIAWTVIPLFIALGMFVWGAIVYLRQFNPPSNAMDVYVVGKQWMWKIQHPEGAREINELHVPLGRPIRLILSSQDVIHDFFIPAFRTKHDVLPGRYVSMWFTPTRLGSYHFFCSQYCGTEHSAMIGRVVVMEPDQYQAWLAGTVSGLSAAQAGERLFSQFACNTCHGQVAPTLAGLYGSRVKLSDGRSVLADDQYLRESILDSTAKIVAGYQPIMPSFRNQITEEQLMQLVEYIKSLKNPQAEKARKP